MALDYVDIWLGVLILIAYLAAIFLLFEIKSRVSGKLGTAFMFLIVGVILLIIRRIIFLFTESAIISVPHLTTALSLVFSIIFLFSIYIFYSALKTITDKPNGKKTEKTGKSSQRKIGRASSTPFGTARKNPFPRKISSEQYLDLTKG